MSDSGKGPRDASAILLTSSTLLTTAATQSTVPYDPAFERRKANPSQIYFGASLAALARLGKSKGYALAGCNGAGNNAFFVRENLRPAALPARTAGEAFVAAKFREARDAQGRLMLLSSEEETKILRGLPVVDVETGATVPF